METVSPDISVVIPLFNEEESLEELYGELLEVLSPLTEKWEVVAVDDGSTDSSWHVLQRLCESEPRCRAVRLRTNFGKSVALMAGFHAARGDVVVTLDADLQDDPHEIPRLLAALEEGCDLVTGWKYPRRDPCTKVLPSKAINALTSWLTGLKLHDMNCGLKAYRRETVRNITLRGGQYRFIPALVSDRGFRVREIKVVHRARKYGTSKYGARRFLTGFLDLLTVLFLTRYSHRPLHIFGTIGLLLSGAGILVVSALALVRIVTGSIMSRHPLLIGGVMLTVVGLQFVFTGLIAEMVSAVSTQQHPEDAHVVSERIH